MVLSQFVMLFPSLINRVRPIFNTGFQNARKHVSKVVIVSGGLMIVSSALVPILCSPKLDLGGYLKPDLATSVLSTACFGYLNRKKIVENCPLVLGIYSFAGFLTLFSPRPLLNELPTWIPLCGAMGILMSISVVPELRAYFLSQSNPTLAARVLADGNNRPEGSYAGTIDPNSSPSNGSSIRSTPFLRLVPHPLEFAHMGIFPMNRRANAEGSSDIDLEEGSDPGFGSSSGSEGSEDPLL